MSNSLALLVEDDSALREMYADVLKRHDFKVVECSTAEAAERFVMTSGDELFAWVTDNNLCVDMTGLELAANARDLLPALNIVVMSGNPVPLLPDNVTFLRKPFPTSQLLAAIKT
jgi:DNA-binding NtrC family response regulator